MSEQVKARITAKGRKKILALGGGIRGMVMIEVPTDIERLISCGAIIAPHEEDGITSSRLARRPGL